MLYKFQSRAAATVIMLPANGQQLLRIIGKPPDEMHGIITAAQIPAAIAALQAAIAADEAAPAQSASTNDEGEAPQPAVSLRQRAAPFMELLRRSLVAGRDVVW